MPVVKKARVCSSYAQILLRLEIINEWGKLGVYVILLNGQISGCIRKLYLQTSAINVPRISEHMNYFQKIVEFHNPMMTNGTLSYLHLFI